MTRFMFKNDYSEGAHPRILELLSKTNFEQQEGYGLDEYSLKAADLIREQIGLPLADVHFLSGGTQTNLVLASAALRPHEGIIAADTAHINVHEAGAIEATGHKIFYMPAKDGKLTVEQLEYAVKFHADEHYIKPKLVFLSNTTELGTVYTKRELSEIYDFCVQHNLFLYIDGARLGNAIVSQENLTLADIANLTDAFYIGGTKNGALLGEALVITNPLLKADFRYLMKQKGALLAKGRVVGIQFLALFEDDLYFELAKTANAGAQKIARAIAEAGFDFLTDSPTNQIFPVLPNNVINRLYEKFDFYVWEKLDKDNSVIRLVTSWATPSSHIDEFISYFHEIVDK